MNMLATLRIALNALRVEAGQLLRPQRVGTDRPLTIRSGAIRHPLLHETI